MDGETYETQGETSEEQHGIPVPSKAELDLQAAKESHDRVELARKQLNEVLESLEGHLHIVDAEDDIEGLATPSPIVPLDPSAPDASTGVPMGATAPEAIGFQQPVAQTPEQDSYWRGFQPVVPANPYMQAQQPIPAQQPMQAQAPMQTQQPIPAQQPMQAQAPMQTQQPMQTQAPMPTPQPAQPQQVPQAVQQPYGQTYTPQIQQPAGYVPAQDFMVQPQPTTPAYTKSNKATVGIVLTVVIGILAIIASVVLGRILAGTGDSTNALIDQLDSMSQEYGQDSGDYYSDHQGGQSGNSGDSDSWGFNQGEGNNQGDGSSQALPDWDDPMWEGQHGASHIEGGGIEADDGELHNAWNASVSYSYAEHEYNKEGTEALDFYNKTVTYDFDIDYPQLQGDIPHLDEINDAIREQAMRFVNMTYINPTSDARSLLETYAPGGYGVPKGADALLESDVDFAIMYNNEDFISIAFSDEQSIGSWLGGFVSLRTINVNLKTGEVYELNDVLNINDEVAEAFIANLSKYDGGNAEQVAGHDSFVGALQGKGTHAQDVTTTFFVDGNGKVNFGATYRFESGVNSARGWWDYTLTDKQLETAKKESSIWDVL